MRVFILSLMYVANNGANDQGFRESYRLNDELPCLIISVQLNFEL